ncbi:MAG: response regulator [Lachnospiraceae bacterium]|nr:response regulator [Lachnospiraceae bacterium]
MGNMRDKKHVLVVDDKNINRYILRSIFEDSYDIIECSNGREAIRVLEQYQEDMAALLLDIVMPDGDGFTVLDFMKQHEVKSVPVIMISSNATEENIYRAYDYDVADYIQKPFEEDVVKRRVESIIHMFEKRKEKMKEK